MEGIEGSGSAGRGRAVNDPRIDHALRRLGCYLVCLDPIDMPPHGCCTWSEKEKSTSPVRLMGTPGICAVGDQG